MSLSQAQKDWIKGSIEHLLDFSSDPNKLTQETEQLLKALKEPVDDKHDFYFIRKCMLETRETMLGIEKYNPDVTLGEIQHYVIELTLEEIKKAGGANSPLVLNVTAAINSLLPDLIPEKNNETPFHTEAPSSSVQYLPWQNMREEGQIHTTSLILNEDGIVYLHAQTDVPYKYSITMPFSNMNQLSSNQPGFQYNYLYNLIPEAKLKANQLIKRCVLDHLFNMQILNSDIHAIFSSNPNIDQVVTHNFYFWHLLKNYLDPWIIADISKEEANNLTDPSVLQALEHNTCSLEQALVLTPTQRQLVATYFTALKKDRANIVDILLSTEEHSKILLIPLIINFINQDPSKLSFQLAKQFKPFFKKLFTSPLYMDFFNRADINWTKLSELQEKDCDLLLNKEIAALVINRIVDITTVPTLIPELTISSCRPNINKLLINKHLTITELEDLPAVKIALIDTHPYLNEWITQGVIKINAFDARNLVALYSNAYSERLHAILMNKPYKFNLALDRTANILGELEEAAVHAKVSKNELRERVMGGFIKKSIINLHDNILALIDNKERKDFLQKYKAMQLNNSNSQFDLNSNTDDNWSSVLVNAIEFANRILQNPSMIRKQVCHSFNLGHHLFPKLLHPDLQKKIIEFCQRFVELGEEFLRLDSKQEKSLQQIMPAVTNLKLG